MKRAGDFSQANPSSQVEIKSYEYTMKGHAEQCVDRYCELAGKSKQKLRRAGTPCIDDHMFASVDFEKQGELNLVASRIVLKMLYLARIGRPDTYWSVNTLARDVTRWSVACDKRLEKLASYLQDTSTYVQHAHVGDHAQDIYLALFSDASFAGDVNDSKSTTGGHTMFGRS